MNKLKELKEQAKNQGDGEYMVRITTDTHIGMIKLEVKDNKVLMSPLDSIGKQYILEEESKHFHCPVNGWDCPHYITKEINGRKEEGVCELTNPYEDCDDFYNMYGDDCPPEDYTDYGEDF